MNSVPNLLYQNWSINVSNLIIIVFLLEHLSPFIKSVKYEGAGEIDWQLRAQTVWLPFPYWLATTPVTSGNPMPLASVGTWTHELIIYLMIIIKNEINILKF